MGTPPRLPNLDPRDMAWVRWATEEIKKTSTSAESLKSNVAAATQLATTTAASHATKVANDAVQAAVNPQVPAGPPQVPTDPTLATDHGTVTIKWDGQVHANLNYTPQAGEDVGSVQYPAAGFNHVSVWRSTTVNGTFERIGSNLGHAGSIVDTNVVVGSTYWYRLVTTDNLGAGSAPSTAVSVTVQGVDLGTLDQDVTNAIQAANDAGVAGQNAAATAQEAANSADAKAAQALQDAATAQTGANTALTAANSKNKVIYSANVASGTAGYIAGDLWFQINNNNVVIGQWQYDGATWVARTLDNAVLATLDAAKITTGYLNSARIAANSISASQMIAGTITAASGILADAVVTTAKIADLAVNNAKINDLDGNKIQANTVVAGKLAANSVTTNNIVAGAIDTNRLAAGAITADKLSIGAVSPQGSPTDRVPMALTNNSWWSGAAYTTYVNSGQWVLGPENVSATASGLVLTSTSTARALAGVTPILPVPVSRKIQVTWKASGPIQVLCREIDSAGNNTWAGLITDVSGTVAHTMASTTVSYGVYFIVNAGSNPAVVTLSSAHVFEVIGTGQGVELSPRGLQFYDATGALAMDLTTNTQQYFSVVDSTGTDPQTVASIDQFGNGSFNSVSANTDIELSGISLSPADPDGSLGYPDSLINATPNGATWDSSVPLLDRLGRGVIYDCTWPSQNGLVVNTQYRRIAQDSFILEDGRSYQFNVDLGGLAATNNSGQNLYVEMQFKVGSPNTSIIDGTSIVHAVVYNGTSGYFVLNPVIFAASAAQTTLDLVNRILPAGVPIYWQINTLMSAVPTTSFTFAGAGLTRGLTVVDIGSSNITRPTGIDPLADTHDYSSSGAASGSTSGGTTATSKTVTFTAKSSRTFNNNGSTIVTGSGTYTNGAAMYYGFGASPMGSWFGNFQDSSGRSLATVLSGKHVTAATLTVKNNYTAYSSGATVTFGTSSATSAPGSIGSPGGSTWSTAFSKGGTKSISLNSTIRSGLASGSVASFQMGVSGSSTNYSYFAGATQSGKPTLKVTYY